MQPGARSVLADRSDVAEAPAVQVLERWRGPLEDEERA